MSSAVDGASMALHETDDLTCPRCGASLFDEREDGETFEAQLVEDDDVMIRARFPCPACGALIDQVTASAAPEALGVDVWIEDAKER